MTTDHLPPVVKTSLRRHPAVLAALLTVLLFGGIGGGFFVDFKHQQHAGCVIQARGLPASHLLARAMGDIQHLIVIPPGAKGIPPKTLAALNDLHMSAEGYAAIESRQPASRKC